MDKDQFYMDIQEADNNSLRIGAANRIVQLLKKQRYSNNEDSAKRWIWELCQNAKDVCNYTGKVKICINFDEDNQKITFRHNGKAFSMANIMSLINQSSSKDRNDGSERESGKFGTGFITTHLLSEIVNISGILETDGSVYSKFRITLDRTGHDKREIVESMERAVGELQECIAVDADEFDMNEYNTIFEYELNEDSMEVARDGLENLKVSAPFVLAMLRDIEEITIENTGEKYRFGQEIEYELENTTLSEIIYESDGLLQKIYILNLSEDSVAVLIALEYQDACIRIMPFSEQQSKLFCDFPLIGTEDFPFPVLVSSRDFNPTEPRDGVFLTCKSKTKIDDEIAQNRSIIEKAYELYQNLLEYAAEKKWDGIYNITKINSYNKKEWYDEEWLGDVVDKCKNIILHTPIIHTMNDSMIALQDFWDDEQAFIISEPKEEMREAIWQLLYYIMPDSIPRKQDIHEWYHSLWEGCNKYTFKSLTKQLHDFNDVEGLEKRLINRDWQSWLKNYYVLIDENKEWQEYASSHQINILPNQNSFFCGVGELYFDVNILEEYKEILKNLGDDSKDWLLHLDFEYREWFRCKEYYNEDILKLIEEQLEQTESDIKEKILQQMVFMYEKTYAGLNMQKTICSYATCILGINQKMIEVSVISEKLLQDALKYTITSVADRISECKTIYGLAEYMNNSTDDAVEFLVEFIEFVVKQGYENLINKVTKPILPNQNGIFTVKDNLFLDDEIDETLKNLTVQAGDDIKEELLMKEVYLELPENRQKRNVDTAQSIIQYVDNNRNSKDEKVRSNFKKLLVWITDNKKEAKLIFPNLYKNKHYLYDDDEIADNIKQAEALNDIMKKFNISSAEKLEEIIRNNSVSAVSGSAIADEITEDILLQYGIDSEEALDAAFSNTDFASQFIRKSKHNIKTYEYVKRILDRSKQNIFSFLKTQEGYDLSDAYPIANTIYVIKKNGKEIYLLARPSDGGEVRIYYRTEMDVLDYSMDWEFWVEDGKTEPKKITFGRMIKLTKLNRIPLKGM